MLNNNNSSRSDPGTSSRGPESVPLMPSQATDNKYQLGNGGSSTNETVVDMNGSPVQSSSNIPPGIFNIIITLFDHICYYCYNCIWEFLRAIFGVRFEPRASVFTIAMQ